MQATTANNTQPLKIFFTGATGYIGGTALEKLLHSSHQGKWHITTLTRSPDTIQRLKELGVTPLLGSLDDTQLLINAVSEADVVMDLADADHLSSAKAIVKGLNDSSTGKRKILIHCSGTGMLAEDVRGECATKKIYNDLDMEAIHAVPITQLHRDVDSYIFENSRNFDSIIVAPPTIHGIGTGSFRKISIQIPMLIRGAIKSGHAGTIGKGLNMWSNVHVEDLGDFFVLLLQKALEGKASTGKDGFYFCENGEHQLKDVVARIGTELHKRNIITQVEPVEFTPEEVAHLDLGELSWVVVGSNSRSKSDRARGLGWKPVETRDSVFESVGKEVNFILTEEKVNGKSYMKS